MRNPDTNLESLRLVHAYRRTEAAEHRAKTYSDDAFRPHLDFARRLRGDYSTPDAITIYKAFMILDRTQNEG